MSYRCGIINEHCSGQPLSVIFYAAAAEGGGVVPRSAPQAVRGRAVNSTALAISWQPPATALRWVTGYRVAISPARLDDTAADVRPSAPIEVVVPAGDSDSRPHARRTTVVVGQLDKFTPYMIAVAALSAGGSGPFSDAIVVQTAEDGTRTRHDPN